MTCHKYINKIKMRKIELSAKLLNLITKKTNIDSWGNLEDSIEQALIKYFKISLEDLYKEEANFENYVYIYTDPSKKGKWKIEENKILDKEPFYVGKGKGKRLSKHLTITSNYKLNFRLNKLKSKNIEPEILIMHENIHNLLAHNIENKYISELRSQGVDLCNLTKQNDIRKYSKNIPLTQLNIESHRNNLILFALNNSKSKKDASEMLNISQRTLYRKIKNLKIKENKGKYYFQKL